MSMPQDTSIEAWKIQLQIYRLMDPVQRLNIAMELTDLSRTLLEKGLERQHPEYPKDKLQSETIRLWLDDDVLYRHLQEAPARSDV